MNPDVTDRVLAGGELKPERPMRGLRILAVTGELPKPDRSGGGLRTFGFLELLAGKHEVTIYPFMEELSIQEFDRYAKMYRQVGIEVLAPTWDDGLNRALITRGYDVVLFEFWHWAERGIEMVRRLQPWAKIVIETVDIHFRREESSLALGISDRATVEARKQAELAVYRAADALICISSEDARALDGYGELGQRFVIPHMAEPRPRSAELRGQELLFVGGFSHAPNPDGLLWFARDVWPTVRASLPEARLTVVGSNPTAEVLDLAQVPGIDVVGWAPDVTPYFDRAAMLIGPIRFGAGVKIKVVESMARGLPVVTTSVGAQGLDVESGKHMLIADDAAGLATHVIDLLQDPERAERIGQAAREFIAQTCQPEAIAARLDALFDAIIDRGRPMIPPSGWVAKWAISRARKTLSWLKPSKSLRRLNRRAAVAKL